ncbi:MAG: VOC family protein [Xanthobacteraceae bacterium]|nr:VOC family protein [Xanthobacteraceae bacterium]
MAGGLHHIVHAVRDLDAAAEFYRRAGFKLGTRNRHPWGTHNFVVQFQGFYIEILALAEPDRLGTDGLAQHFGRFNRDAIARGDGFSMLLRESADIDRDVADFARGGIGTSGPLSFTRDATLPNGTMATLGFSLAFARAPGSPDVGFAACQEHNGALFWNEALQRHDNGASRLAGVVFTARDPARHRDVVSVFAGGQDVRSTAAGIAATTPRGQIDIVSEIGFSEAFGVGPGRSGEGLQLAGLRLVVRDLAALEQVLERGRIAPVRHAGRVVVGPDQAFGATLIFEA